jgi:phosphocarrier protein
MVEKLIKVSNRAGVHARPAALIVQTTKDFKSNIYIEKGTERINAKSIMGVITLGAAYGTELKIIADGDEDGQAAVDALVTLFNSNFQEGD